MKSWILSIVLFLYGANLYAGLLETQILSPFNLGASDLENFNKRFEALANEELEFLKNRESELEIQKQQLDEASRGVTHFVESLMSEFELLSPETQRALLEQKIEGFPVPEADQARLQGMQEHLQNSKVPATSFINDLDVYIQRSLDYSVFLIFKMVSENVEQLRRENTDEWKLKKLKSLYEEMYKFIYDSEKGYVKKRNEYGQAKDTNRISAYNHFFDYADTFFATVAALVGVEKSRAWALQVRKKISSLKRLPELVAIVPDAARALWATIRKTQPTDTTIPLMDSVNATITKVADMRGWEFKVQGAENIPREYDKGTINLFTPSHRDALKDMATMAHLGIEQMAPFAAAGNFLPFMQKFLIKRLNGNLGIIVVGKAHNPNPVDVTEKAIEIARKTGIRNFLIYPEGRLPDRQGAAGPMRDKFFSKEGPIQRFEELGFKVNLIPITMASNYLPTENSQQIDVKVYPTITDKVRRVLTTLAGPDGLATLYRYGLVGDLKTDSQLLWGQRRATRMWSDFSKRFRLEKIKRQMCLNFY